jgi:hypothetical protein
MDQEDSKKLDQIMKFLCEQMPTKEDLKEFATKADIQTESNKVLSAVDGIAKQMQTYNDELPAIQQQLREMKDWIMEAAKRIGVEYKG